MIFYNTSFDTPLPDDLVIIKELLMSFFLPTRLFSSPLLSFEDQINGILRHIYCPRGCPSEGHSYYVMHRYDPIYYNISTQFIKYLLEHFFQFDHIKFKSQSYLLDKDHIYNENNPSNSTIIRFSNPNYQRYLKTELLIRFDQQWYDKSDRTFIHQLWLTLLQCIDFTPHIHNTDNNNNINILFNTDNDNISMSNNIIFSPNYQQYTQNHLELFKESLNFGDANCRSKLYKTVSLIRQSYHLVDFRDDHPYSIYPSGTKLYSSSSTDKHKDNKNRDNHDDSINHKNNLNINFKQITTDVNYIIADFFLIPYLNYDSHRSPYSNDHRTLVSIFNRIYQHNRRNKIIDDKNDYFFKQIHHIFKINEDVGNDTDDNGGALSLNIDTNVDDDDITPHVDLLKKYSTLSHAIWDNDDVGNNGDDIGDIDDTAYSNISSKFSVFDRLAWGTDQQQLLVKLYLEFHINNNNNNNNNNNTTPSNVIHYLLRQYSSFAAMPMQDVKNLVFFPSPHCQKRSSNDYLTPKADPCPQLGCDSISYGTDPPSFWLFRKKINMADCAYISSPQVSDQYIDKIFASTDASHLFKIFYFLINIYFQQCDQNHKKISHNNRPIYPFTPELYSDPRNKECIYFHPQWTSLRSVVYDFKPYNVDRAPNRNAHIKSTSLTDEQKISKLRQDVEIGTTIDLPMCYHQKQQCIIHRIDDKNNDDNKAEIILPTDHKEHYKITYYPMKIIASMFEKHTSAPRSTENNNDQYKDVLPIKVIDLNPIITKTNLTPTSLYNTTNDAINPIFTNIDTIEKFYQFYAAIDPHICPYFDNILEIMSTSSKK